MVTDLTPRPPEDDEDDDNEEGISEEERKRQYDKEVEVILQREGEHE